MLEVSGVGLTGRGSADAAGRILRAYSSNFLQPGLQRMDSVSHIAELRALISILVRDGCTEAD